MSFLGKLKSAALLAPAADGSASTNKIELGDEQLDTLLSFVNENSYVDAYGEALEARDITQGSITYLKDAHLQLRDKTGIGMGTIDKALFSQVTVYLGAHKDANSGFRKSDLNAGLQAAAEKKLANGLAQFRTYRERQGMAAIVAAGTAVASASLTSAVLKSTADCEVANAEILEQVVALTSLVDKAQALDTIAPELVFIDLNPVTFATLVRLGFATKADMDGDLFQAGRFAVAKLGGYTVRSNEYLAGAKAGATGSEKEVLAVIAAKFAGKAPMRMDAANFGRFDGSNDVVAYIEATFGSDKDNAEKIFTPVYENVIKVLTVK